MKPLLVRALIITFMLLSLRFLPGPATFTIYAFGFAHYLLGTLYSYPQLKNICRHQKKAFGMLLLLGAGFLLLELDRRHAFTFIFGAHIVLAEAYDLYHQQNQSKYFSLSRICFFFSLYYILAWMPLFFVPAPGYVWSLPINLLVIMYLLVKDKSEWLRGSFPSDLFLMVICFILWKSDVIPNTTLANFLLASGFYHFSYWLIAPMIYQTQEKPFRPFLYQMLLFSMIFIGFFFYGQRALPDFHINLYDTYLMVSFLHALLSLGISKQNPAIFKNFFFSSRV